MASFQLKGTYEKYEPKELSISIYGNVRKISFEEFIDSDLIKEGESVDLQTNELMQTNTTIYNVPIGQLLFDNISSDYSEGIATAKITVVCSDIYDINGNKIRDWQSGEIYKIGDIIRVDKDNNGNSLWSYKNGSPMFWKVTGRNFRKFGVPMIDLELQEVQVI